MRRAGMAANGSLQAFYDGLIQSPSRQHNDRNMCGRLGSAQPCQQILCIAVRHEIIGYDDGGFVPASYPESLVCVGCKSDVDPTFFEPAGAKPVDVGVVIDQ
jgi:hypothetical protein